MRDRPQRILLIVAPTIFECRRAIESFGLDLGHLDRMRSVTRAHHLRGWSRGTPFIAINRETWSRDQQAWDLDRTLDACIVAGRLRIASERDLEELRIRSVA
ncbi:hypothetical protein [Mycoplana rhizolycopersici]|uniref:Uncharacterized protein n=1 Tax=Mycoplana rhizolycopersici TaxID=2746702 RepID=A0ABX2QFT3_9HYPH|nr:hypothetical protein [Rhizobium rhizolycopersici]NVP56068.1 hypothetical protein [Rhizobium rhizolycopersici]